MTACGELHATHSLHPTTQPDTNPVKSPLDFVADSKPLKLLLVEDDLVDEVLLSEALIEIDEQREWCDWRSSSIVHVEQLADAVDCLRQELFDVVLLNLSLPDSPALLDSFLAANACARGAPIVVLADEKDESLSHLLLREGAQDVLLKSEIDCGPLARSLRYAIERQRRTKSLLASPFVDDLTGALTLQGFLTIGSHYEKLSTPLLAATLELAELPENTQEDREAAELLLIRAAEVLRGTFESPMLLGRVSPFCFGLIIPGSTLTIVDALLNRSAREIDDAARGLGRRSVARYSVIQLDGITSIEELFGDNAHLRTKTAMLAD